MRYRVGNMSYDSEYLEHFGIKGMQWGRRRFQDENGILTAAGKARYDIGNAVGGAFRSASNAVGGAARSAGNAISRGASSVGSAVSSGARSAGNAISRGVSTVRSTVSSGARAVDKTMGFSAPSRLNQARSELANVQRRQDYSRERADARYERESSAYDTKVSQNKRLESRAQGHDIRAQEARKEAAGAAKAGQTLSKLPHTSAQSVTATSSYNAGAKAASQFLKSLQTANYNDEAAKAYRLLTLQNNPQEADYYTSNERTVDTALATKKAALESEIESLEKEVDNSVLSKVKKTFGKGKSWVTGLFGK